MKEFVLQHLSELITALLAVLVGWVAKTKTTKKVEEADLTKLVQQIYKDMVEDTERRLNQNTMEIEQLKKKLEDQETYWKAKLAEVDKKGQNKYTALQRQNTDLKKRITELENDHNRPK